MDDADLKARAASLKLDPAAFGTCLASDRFDAAIRASFEEGTRAGVNSTPSLLRQRAADRRRAFPSKQFQEVVDGGARAQGS